MYLTDLWIVLPDRAFYGLLRLIGVSPDAAHEWLCDVWGCRCEEAAPPECDAATA